MERLDSQHVRAHVVDCRQDQVGTRTQQVELDYRREELRRLLQKHGDERPLDAYMYAPEISTPREIISIDKEMVPLMYSADIAQFCSFHDFTQS